MAPLFKTCRADLYCFCTVTPSIPQQTCNTAAETTSSFSTREINKKTLLDFVDFSVLLIPTTHPYYTKNLEHSTNISESMSLSHYIHSYIIHTKAAYTHFFGIKTI